MFVAVDNVVKFSPDRFSASSVQGTSLGVLSVPYPLSMSATHAIVLSPRSEILLSLELAVDRARTNKASPRSNRNYSLWGAHLRQSTRLGLRGVMTPSCATKSPPGAGSSRQGPGRCKYGARDERKSIDPAMRREWLVLSWPESQKCRRGRHLPDETQRVIWTTYADRPDYLSRNSKH